MTRTLDSAAREALAERMRFYRDLGLTEFYRRPPDATVADAAVEGQGTDAQAEVVSAAAPAGGRDAGVATSLQEAPANTIQENFFGEDPTIKTRKGFHAPDIGAAVRAEERAGALEAIREIVGFGEGLVGRLLMFDARAMRVETLSYAWDPDNPLSGTNPTLRDLSVHA